MSGVVNVWVVNVLQSSTIGDNGNKWRLWQQMARLESDISWMWNNKTGFSGRMLQEVVNLLMEIKSIDYD